MKPTILIADDEPAGRKVIESVLINQGYELEFAANGKEVLQKASALKPDLILLDIMMPEMDGMEVCERLRKDRDLAEVPIVMVTALDDRNTRIASLNAGADDFISKPIDRAELRARVSTITRLNRYRLLHEKTLITSWIADKASDGYLQLDAKDKIIYANSRARFYLGLDIDPTQPITDAFMNIVTRQYIPNPQPAWADWPMISTSNSAGSRYLVRPESNTAHEFWLEFAIYEIPGAEGVPRARVIRLHDVTAEVLNRRNTRSFGEAISHKIRTPVSHIVSSLDLLARLAPQMPQDEIVRFASTALQGAKRLYETMNRILKYANLHANVNGLEGFNISDLKQLVEKISEEMGLSNIPVVIGEGLNMKQLVLPFQSMEVIFWELLGNSLKFHPDGAPVIKVEVFRAAGSHSITFRVSDNGMTLSPRQLSIAWLPYYQGEKDFTGEAPGMGLGLSTVSSIVWGAGGACRIMNQEDGSGVVVEFAIPEMNNDDLSMTFTGDLDGRI
jgi:DNA-binding response OmpR family regulator/two-component sensor histidine kinase